MEHDGRNDALIVFTPSGKRGRFPVGTPVLQAARALGVDIDSVCGGRAICGRCQVTPSIGEFSKHGITSKPENLGPVTQVEIRYDEKRGLKADRRLSCQTLIQGDTVVDVPPESQVHKQVVRKRAEVRDIKLDPVTKLYYIVVEEPDMHHPSSDLERVYHALESQWGIKQVTCDLAIMQALQSALRKGEWRITIAIHSRMASRVARITAIWPGFHDRAFGMAVDVGSTTLAAHLCDLATGELKASAGL
ncbi:MAG: 2Fe-2S iron-sulfur cluster-binding protein, partial [Anderseniella sp.]